MDDKIATCPDCGAGLCWEKTREVGQPYRREELAMWFAPDALAELKKLPKILGYRVGATQTQRWCSECAYREIDGQVIARGNAK